jgi:hypothetical protein
MKARTGESADGAAARPPMALEAVDPLPEAAEVVVARNLAMRVLSLKYSSLATLEMPAARNWSVTSPEMESRFRRSS